MRFPSATRRDPAVDRWMDAHPGALGALARRWFEAMRACGEDVRELLHDGQPTACVGDAAFGYVDAFAHHVDVGFYLGACIADPDALLQGRGRFMRHVKLGPRHAVDDAALAKLVRASCDDMRERLRAVDGPARQGAGANAVSAKTPQRSSSPSRAKTMRT